MTYILPDKGPYDVDDTYEGLISRVKTLEDKIRRLEDIISTFNQRFAILPKH